MASQAWNLHATARLIKDLTTHVKALSIVKADASSMGRFEAYQELTSSMCELRAVHLSKCSGGQPLQSDYANAERLHGSIEQLLSHDGSAAWCVGGETGCGQGWCDAPVLKSAFMGSAREQFQQDQTARKGTMASQVVVFFSEFLQRLGNACCQHESYKYFFPRATGDLNMTPQGAQFKRGLDHLMQAKGNDAAKLAEDIRPLALGSAPSAEAEAIAAAMAGCPAHRTSITLVSVMSTLQIKMAQLCVAWLSGDRLQSKFGTQEWALAMGAAKKALQQAQAIEHQVEPIKAELEQAMCEGDPIEKQVAESMLPWIKLFKSIAARSEQIIVRMEAEVKTLVVAFLQVETQKVQELYPTTWTDWAANPATRDSTRVGLDILRNVRHKEINDKIATLEKSIASLGLLGHSNIDIESHISSAKAVAEDAHLYVASAGVLNLVVKKKASRKFSDEDLKGMARTTRGVLIDLRLWWPCKRHPGKKITPDALRQELLAMAGMSEGIDKEAQVKWDHEQAAPAADHPQAAAAPAAVEAVEAAAAANARAP